MSKPDWVKEHIEEYRKNPEKGHMWDSSVVGGPGEVPCLLLTTTGRKSGKERTTTLIYSFQDGGYVIIASKVVDGEKRERLWEAMVKVWPDYDNYQKKTDREIPVVLLLPK